VRTPAAVATTCILALAAPSALAQPSAGEIDFRRVLDLSRGPYIEGSVGFLRVRDARGSLVLEESVTLRARWRVRRRLPEGRYRVTSFERPCVANCSLLDPPRERCSRRVRILAGGRTGVRVTVRPHRGCRMRARARPALFPSAERVRAARRFLGGRAGVESWALIDSHGRLHGLHARRVYVSASLVKAMLLVAYLRQAGNRAPTPSERATLGPMITESDNELATAVFAQLGDAALRDLAGRAGMRSFSIAGYWSGATFSAADQARFFRVFDRLISPSSRGYARGLLSSIVSWQRWGFSRYSLAAGFETFFKGGWRGTELGRLVHEAALFERGPLRVSMALLSDGNPSHDYGTATLRGVASRIFGRPGARPAASDDARPAATDQAGSPAHRRAGLVDIHRFAPGIHVELAYRTRRNLTGRPLPGYCENWGLLLEPAARDLARVQRYLRRRGLGLLVMDAYRPARATRALVDWARSNGRADLVGTYIASRSRHNTGSAVDLTLVRAPDGRRLRMGSGFDDLSARAHTRGAGGRALRNRLILQRAMERFGFSGYWREWWHFEHHRTGTVYLDLPLGC
jgi:D-alanyl-D-alanine dipeptidase